MCETINYFLNYETNLIKETNAMYINANNTEDLQIINDSERFFSSPEIKK